MARITKFGAQRMLLASFAPELVTIPGSVYLALTTTLPSIEATGSTLIEPVGGSYARSLYGIGGSYWALSGSTTVVNTYDITWSTPTIAWGRIVGWAMCTDVSGGSVIACGELSTPRYVGAASTVSLPAGSLRIRMEF